MVAQAFVERFPIGELVEHPENPRRGDEGAIEASMRRHGFYGAVLVQRSTNHIIAGNHRVRVARREGYDAVPALVLDVDDDQARRILLVDNRTNDTATYDDEVLASILRELEGAYEGTGFDQADLDKLLAGLEAMPLPDTDVRPLDRSAVHSCPFCGAEWVDTASGPERA